MFVWSEANQWSSRGALEKPRSRAKRIRIPRTSVFPSTHMQPIVRQHPPEHPHRTLLAFAFQPCCTAVHSIQFACSVPSRARQRQFFSYFCFVSSVEHYPRCDTATCTYKGGLISYIAHRRLAQAVLPFCFLATCSTAAIHTTVHTQWHPSHTPATPTSLHPTPHQAPPFVTVLVQLRLGRARYQRTAQGLRARAGRGWTAWLSSSPMAPRRNGSPR